MQIREYRTDDSADVKELILSVLKKEYPFDQSAYNDTDINNITETYSGAGNVFFVIEEDEKIVGTIGVKKDSAHIALIRRFFVNEVFRKRGFGSALVKNAIEFCKNNKYSEINFRATDRMRQAISLCKKMNFKEKEDLEVSGFHIHIFYLTI